MTSRLPQARVEHQRRGEAIGHLPGRRLEIADGDAGARAKKPIGLADVEAALLKSCCISKRSAIDSARSSRGPVCTNAPPPRSRSAEG